MFRFRFRMVDSSPSEGNLEMDLLQSVLLPFRKLMPLKWLEDLHLTTWIQYQLKTSQWHGNLESTLENYLWEKLCCALLAIRLIPEGNTDGSVLDLIIQKKRKASPKSSFLKDLQKLETTAEVRYYNAQAIKIFIDSFKCFEIVILTHFTYECNF